MGHYFDHKECLQKRTVCLYLAKTLISDHLPHGPLNPLLLFSTLISQIHSKDINKHKDALKDKSITGKKYDDLKDKLSKCLEKEHLINVCDLSSGAALGKQMDKAILAALKKGMSLSIIIDHFQPMWAQTVIICGVQAVLAIVCSLLKLRIRGCERTQRPIVHNLSFCDNCVHLIDL